MLITLTAKAELMAAIQSVTDGSKSTVIDQRLKASKVLQANWGNIETTYYELFEMSVPEYFEFAISRRGKKFSTIGALDF